MRVNSPLFLPLEPPRQHSRVRLICLMTPLCITVLYNRPLPYWFGIFSYGLYFFGHCLLKSGTLPSSFTDVRLSFRFAWFVLRVSLYGWVRRGREGREGERDCRFRDLLPSAGRYSPRAVVRHTFGSLTNRPCLEEVNNSRPKELQGVFWAYDWLAIFLARIPKTRCIFAKSSSRVLLVPLRYGHVICDETKKLNIKEIG